MRQSTINLEDLYKVGEQVIGMVAVVNKRKKINMNLKPQSVNRKFKKFQPGNYIQDWIWYKMQEEFSKGDHTLLHEPRQTFALI